MKGLQGPYGYAVLACAYIMLVVQCMTYIGRSHLPDNSLLTPVIALSLFVLSAAVMGFLFFYEPLMLFLKGKYAEGIGFFARTVVTFAVLTVVILLVAFLIG